MSRRKLAKGKATRAAKARAAQAARTKALEATTIDLTPKGGLRRVLSLRGARETALTVGAIVGVFCMLLAVAAFAFGIQPVIFRSGSMSPAINTGALAISKSVDANDLAVGDIVTVLTGSGIRVTHRIQDLSVSNGQASLVLRGDANNVADEHVYVVKSADRVLFDIPKAGFVVSWISGPIGIFGGGLLVGLLLLTAFGPGTRTTNKPGTRRMLGFAVVALAIGVCATGVTGTQQTQAYYTNAAKLTSGTFTAGTYPAATPLPAPTGFTCTHHNNKATWTWNVVTGATGYNISYKLAASPTYTVKNETPGSVTTTFVNSLSGTYTTFITATGPNGGVASATKTFVAGGADTTCS